MRYVPWLADLVPGQLAKIPCLVYSSYVIRQLIALVFTLATTKLILYNQAVSGTGHYSSSVVSYSSVLG